MTRSFRRRINSAASSAKSRALRCAIYTRVSTDQGLEQDFNSLDGLRRLYPQPSARRLDIGSRPPRRRRLLRRQHRSAGPYGSARGGDYTTDRRHRCLQGRSVDALARRLRQARGGFRRRGRLFHLHHPILQYDNQHGAADPQHAAVVRPVRAQGVGHSAVDERKPYRDQRRMCCS
jgi:hypothetical protein